MSQSSEIKSLVKLLPRRYRALGSAVIALVLLLVSILLARATAPDLVDTDISSLNSYKVVSVVDGDTFKLDYNGKTETVRMIGIDTPETVDPRKSVQCFGKQASDKLKSLLTGKTVYVESDPTQGERDKYGRLLLYVWVNKDDPNLSSQVFVNEYMIEEGFAHEYTYNTPYKYQAQFKQAETSAREGSKGLWGSCNTTT